MSDLTEKLRAAGLPSDDAAREVEVVDHFTRYWRANYPNDVVISNSEWHLKRLQSALRGALAYLARPPETTP